MAYNTATTYKTIQFSSISRSFRFLFVPHRTKRQLQSFLLDMAEKKMRLLLD